jgi:carboxymethylenebutenolidase
MSMSRSHPDGYLSTPLDGQGDPVLVLHPWWGLNDTIRAFCDRLAAEDFVVFAPDLYHGQVVDTIPEAEAAVNALSRKAEQAQAEVAEAAAFLSERADGRGLAVIGFSMGGYYGMALASAAPDLVRKMVIFYSTGDADFSTSRAAYLGHFAGDDDFEPRPYVDEMEEAIRSAGRSVTFHHYPGTGHWFYESDRTDAYNEEAAELAWERTLAFLKGT